VINRDKYAIAGLGVTRHGKVPGISSRKFQAEAMRLAITDAGLKREDIGGVIFEDPASGALEDAPARMLGLPLNFYWKMQVGGATCLSCLCSAMGAIELGLAEYVIVVYGDNAASISSSPSARTRPYAGQIDATFGALYGDFAPVTRFAPMARAHMARYGTTSRQFGMIAVADRQYAASNPEAYFYNKPITIEDHQNSPMIADPFHLLDCCMISDGGIAFVVTTAERAEALRHPPVYIKGVGMGNQIKLIARGRNRDTFTETDAATAKEQAFRMAEVELKDIDVAQIYDAFSAVLLIQLEDYGFCKKGEGGPFVESGNVGPDAPLPINTAGGMLGWDYFEGFTPMTEGIRQIRGDCGPRQVKDAELCLVTGTGAYRATYGPGHPRVISQACAVLGRKG